MGRRFGFGHVSVFANSRNKSVPKSGTPVYRLFLFHASHCFFSFHGFPSSLNVCCFSPSFCVQHIFVDLESGTVGKPRPSVKAKSTFVPDSLLTDFGFLDGQLSFGIFCKWLHFT